MRFEARARGIIRLHDDDDNVQNGPDPDSRDDLVADDLGGAGFRRKGVEETRCDRSQYTADGDARPR